ncbi:MAG: hypothetical protein IT168_30680 [Bryobacterales bacterium]|nr:hypothetical protein [Bryobacterales bacterium]
MKPTILHRRNFLETALAAHALPFAIPAAETTPKMQAWIFMHSPLERWMNNYTRIMDAWHEGGVRGIGIGYMNFVQPNGSPIPTYEANPKTYEAFGLTPPPAGPRDPAKEKLLHQMLDYARKRDWEILIFASVRGGGGKKPNEDPYGAISYAAGVQDMMNAYPQAAGVIIDGPGEHHYELAFHHGGELLELRQWERTRYAALGMDVPRMEKGIERLRARLHGLTPAMVRYHRPAGLLAGMALFDLNEDTLYWLRMRQESTMGYFAAIRAQIDKLNRKVKLTGIPRAATFSVLTTQDYQRMAPYFDYIFPKHYFWHRGFDGMYGTIARWVQKIQEWNPSLTEEDCFSVVKAWFGIELPGVKSLADMEMGFPQEFFDKIVYQETRRALDAIGDDNKVIAWVSTGRAPHAGDPMGARDLYKILAASQKAGLKRFLFHPDPDLGAPEWSVISGMCGKQWKEGTSDYWPSDTPRNERFNGGRKPGDNR